MQENKKLWFKRKTYGWGWVPSSWQGWLVIVLYIVFLILDFRFTDLSEHSTGGMLVHFTPRLVVFTVILIFICYKKGEKPRWSWGK